jgi:Ribonuclease toxin, BrnT, of type II toxin-antitoxin system
VQRLANELAREDNRLYTTSVRFEWDRSKAAANLRTHRVSFAEAVTVLEDEFALTREDPDAVDEPRFVTLGLSNLGNLLVRGLRAPRTGYHQSDFSLEGE